MRFLKHWRALTGLGLFILAELMLFGAAEGPQKWQWIMAGSVPDFLLAAGFIFLGRFGARPSTQRVH
jgi:hypothetical protein